MGKGSLLQEPQALVSPSVPTGPEEGSPLFFLLGNPCGVSVQMYVPCPPGQRLLDVNLCGQEA